MQACAAGTGVLHQREHARGSAVVQPQVHAEVLRPAPVVDVRLGVGRDEGDVAGAYGVDRLPEGQRDLVMVEVQLPQVGQPEDVVRGGDAVYDDARTDRGGRLVEPNVTSFTRTRDHQQWTISAHDGAGFGPYVRRMSTSRQVFLRLDGLVPEGISQRAVATMAEGLTQVSYGTPLDEAFTQDTSSMSCSLFRSSSRRGEPRVSATGPP
jgi:hypothetical protein